MNGRGVFAEGRASTNGEAGDGLRRRTLADPALERQRCELGAGGVAGQRVRLTKGLLLGQRVESPSV